MCLNSLVYFTILTISAVGSKADELRVAGVHIVHPQVSMDLTFTEAENGVLVSRVIYNYSLPGMSVFHIHELGDISNCNATGGYFQYDFDGHSRHSRNFEAQREVIFIGNKADGGDVHEFVDKRIGLRGHNSILGRSFVIHELEEKEDDHLIDIDDLDISNRTRLARVACGVIGIKSPATAWNAAAAFGPSFVMFIILSVFFIFNLGIDFTHKVNVLQSVFSDAFWESFPHFNKVNDV